MISALVLLLLVCVPALIAIRLCRLVLVSQSALSLKWEAVSGIVLPLK